MSPAAPQVSIPGIVDVEILRGSAASGAAGTDLLIEIPHGSTATADFTALAARLTSPLPDGLVDFFHVNTDAGAPELAEAIARRLLIEEPQRVVTIVRSRIPRTFIDCNRRIETGKGGHKAGEVTPGLMPWISTPDDRAMLAAALNDYLGAVAAAISSLLADGALLQLHTYAPRSVEVDVDHNIVTALHDAYRPEVVETWKLRAPVDAIRRDLDGTDHGPPAVLDNLREAVAEVGLTLGDSETYPLHPSTLAYDHALALPGRTLCLEVRRDLLADPFEPFAQMKIGPDKVARLAGPIAVALRRFW